MTRENGTGNQPGWRVEGCESCSYSYSPHSPCYSRGTGSIEVAEQEQGVKDCPMETRDILNYLSWLYSIELRF